MNAVTAFGKTPLHTAADYGQEHIVRQLLAASPALIDKLDCTGRTALHGAVENNREAIADLLVEARPDLVFGVDILGNNILHFINKKMRKEFVEKVWRWNPKALYQTQSFTNSLSPHGPP